MKRPGSHARLRDEGLQRINDLFTAWHGKKQGRISVFPAAALAETSSPELLQAVRAFAEKHDLGYTIHLSQSRAEVDFMVRHHGVRPPAFLDRHGFLGPRLFAAHCRYVDDADIALLGASGTIISHQAAMAANRGVIPPIPALRAAGCPIANGTDNNTNDLFEVMRVALLTERISRDDAIPGVRPQPEDMLEDATQGGARAVQQRKDLGSLEVGQEGRPHRRWTRSARTSCRRDASCPRGSTTVSRPTSSRAWSTASSSCATARSSRWTRTASSPKPTRSGGGSGARCWKPARSPCRAGRSRGQGSDDHGCI